MRTESDCASGRQGTILRTREMHHPAPALDFKDTDDPTEGIAMDQAQDTRSAVHKALTLNLDACKYGTIAEIGAGQEVARFFFRAGGAAGTIAKSMSAYDMQFSDAIYGTEENRRYVSLGRLMKMLDYEFSLTVERLAEIRSKNSTFFAFADTVAALSYSRKSNCHGWLGVRLQLYPGAPPSDIILHVNMLDHETEQQQEALGILGVNLIYGAFYHYRDPKQLIESLMDNLVSSRIDIDLIKFSGPYFEEIENRLMNLYLVHMGFTQAVMFLPSGEVVQASEVLYKKHVLVIRGSFRPVTKVNIDMINCGSRQFLGANKPDTKQVMTLVEITMAQLMLGHDIDDQDFLARVDLLGSLGYTVMISNYLQYYKLQAYFRRYTNRNMGIVLGVPNVKDIFNEKYYDDLEGGILECFGKLFSGKVTLYVYPMYDRNTSELETIQNLRVDHHLRLLYRYLVENHFIVGMEGFDKELLSIFSRDVLRKIKEGRTDWKEQVPELVANQIVERRLFGYDTE